MEQSPSGEPNWFTANQDNRRILWNSQLHYRIHTCPPSAPVLSHIDPVHAPDQTF
jgi:hypothetical protein